MGNHSWLNKELYSVTYLKCTVIKSVLVLTLLTSWIIQKGGNAAYQRRDSGDGIQWVWISVKHPEDVSTSALSVMREILQIPHLKRITPWNTYEYISLQWIKSLCFSVVGMVHFLKLTAWWTRDFILLQVSFLPLRSTQNAIHTVVGVFVVCSMLS